MGGANIPRKCLGGENGESYSDHARTTSGGWWGTGVVQVRRTMGQLLPSVGFHCSPPPMILYAVLYTAPSHRLQSSVLATQPRKLPKHLLTGSSEDWKNGQTPVSLATESWNKLSWEVLGE